MCNDVPSVYNSGTMPYYTEKTCYRPMLGFKSAQCAFVMAAITRYHNYIDNIARFHRHKGYTFVKLAWLIQLMKLSAAVTM